MCPHRRGAQGCGTCAPQCLSANLTAGDKPANDLRRVSRISIKRPMKGFDSKGGTPSAARSSRFASTTSSRRGIVHLSTLYLDQEWTSIRRLERIWYDSY